MRLIDKLKLQFNLRTSAIDRLLIINIGVYIFSALMVMVAFLFNWQYNPDARIVTNPVLEYFYLPSLYKDIIFRPWTILTHMFFHAGFWHLLFNMLLLFFMGRISSMYMSNERIYRLYFYGGLAGAFLLTLAYNFLPVFSDLTTSVPSLGASAAIMSIVIGTVTLVPNMEVYYFGIYRIKLKWIGLLIVFMDIVALPTENPGGHIAHLGGALFGFLFITGIREGWNIPLPKINLPYLRKIFPSKQKLDERKIYRNRRQEREPAYHETESNGGKRTFRHTDEKPNQEEIDAILDKISQSGYQSLTDHEKEVLFRASE